jgi:membrane-associated phospholipid phosphatase
MKLLVPIANKKVLLPLAVVVFISVVILVFVRKDARLDAAVFDMIGPHITKSRTSVMEFISFFGNHMFLIPANLLLVLLFAWKKEKWMAIKVAVIALSSLSLMSLIKNIAQRHRPDNPLVDGITNYSFPSGHAFMSVAFFGLLIIVAKSVITQRNKQLLFTILLLLVIVVIGFSRVYLRVHFTTDVLAGWSLGSLWLVAMNQFTDKLELKNTVRKQ